MDYKAHWSHIYQTKAANQVSWYQTRPTTSLQLIQQTGVAPDDAIIDVGAGASTLVDNLLAGGYRKISLLDVSAEALQITRERLGEQAALVEWMEGDVTTLPLPRQHYALWHDRAVFHFLSDAAARQRYVEQVEQAIQPGGHVIVATFALDGPQQCSGLNIVQYDAASLHHAFGSPFTLISSTEETHMTPWGAAQQFVYCYCRMSASSKVLA
jgi:ubiquinone/menaquinone biosynthesis C-methylase UbiE